MTPQALIAMYRAAREEEHSITPRHLSELISIFGRLSLPSDSPQIKNRYVEAMDVQKKESYWGIVDELLVDKEALGYLSNGDRYWRLCSRLAEIQAAKGGMQSRERVSLAVSDAIEQYSFIWRTTKAPDILAPYFDMLLSNMENQGNILTAISQLCELLSVHRQIHPGIIRIVWRIALMKPEVIPNFLKERLLTTLWCNVQTPLQAVKGSRVLATHAFNSSTKRHQPLPIDTQRLSALLTAPVFPFFSVSVPRPLSEWTKSLFENSLSPDHSLTFRWSNLSLLAMYHSVSTSRTLDLPPSLDSSQFTDWHMILMAGILEEIVPNYPSPEKLRGLVRLLWQRWRQAPSEGTRPSLVTRAFVGTCFQLARHTVDPELCHSCFRFALRRILFSVEGMSRSERAQIVSFTNHFVQSFVELPGRRWIDLFQSVDQPSVIMGHHADLFIQSLVSRDIHSAHQLFKHCAHHSIPLSPETHRVLVVASAGSRPSDSISLLNLIPDRDIHEVLSHVLQSLWVCRRQYVRPVLAKTLGDVMLKDFTTKLPPRRLLRPIMHSLSLLIAANAHCAQKAVQIFGTIYKAKPSYFPSDSLRYLLQALLRHRRFRLSMHFARLIGNTPITVMDDLRETLVLHLIRGGATHLARSYHTAGRPRPREVIARFIRCRRRASPDVASEVLPILQTNINDVQTLTFAILILLDGNLPSLARKIMMTSSPRLDMATRTLLVNAYLDHMAQRCRRSPMRNRQALRSLSRTVDFFAQRIGFLPDRITTNIFVKSLLQSRRFGSIQVRALFDHLVRHGLSVANRWRHGHNVPFSTPPLHPTHFQLPLPDTKVTFNKHSRPLLKMFIKALYLRGDIAAAKMVVGILKDEEAADMLRKERQPRGPKARS
ncbi:hypothetical protein VNI00_005196 [Paramarasmius palmivorus]|uniref:Uncharacterized protein n=1 Tax=Paramarasmius palmivorus TaxID=297713 RepID=A0AAW0DIY0_9AGAR